jgi:hypothetical protein
MFTPFPGSSANRLGTLPERGSFAWAGSKLQTQAMFGFF